MTLLRRLAASLALAAARRRQIDPTPQAIDTEARAMEQARDAAALVTEKAAMLRQARGFVQNEL